MAVLGVVVCMYVCMHVEVYLYVYAMYFPIDERFISTFHRLLTYIYIIYVYLPHNYIIGFIT